MSRPESETSIGLEPTAILQRAPELTLQVGSDGSTTIEVDDRIGECGAHTLSILDAFSRPVTFQAALESLQTRVHGPQEWIDLTTNIMHLYEAGALVDVSSATPTLKPNRRGFAGAAIHIKMLNDRARTGSYLAAIAEVVKPGDVVVDLGTGTGVLSVAAAKAGARHVYAIEASSIGRSALSVFEANDLTDRITLVPGWSTQVNLAERGDVLVSEIIGNEPLEERILEATADAIKRHLKPDARFIPRTVRVYGLPVEVPEAVMAEHRFTKAAQTSWNDWYGIDFGSLYEAASHTAPYLFLIRPFRTRDWVRLSDPCLLVEIDLSTSTHRIENAASVITNARGTVSGLLMYFELALSPNVVLSLHPDRVEETCSWHVPVWLTKSPFEVEPGERLSIGYSYRGSRVQSRVAVERVAG